MAKKRQKKSRSGGRGDQLSNREVETLFLNTVVQEAAAFVNEHPGSMQAGTENLRPLDTEHVHLLKAGQMRQMLLDNLVMEYHPAYRPHLERVIGRSYRQNKITATIVDDQIFAVPTNISMELGVVVAEFKRRMDRKYRSIKMPKIQRVAALKMFTAEMKPPRSEFRKEWLLRLLCNTLLHEEYHIQPPIINELNLPLVQGLWRDAYRQLVSVEQEEAEGGAVHSIICAMQDVTRRNDAGIQYKGARIRFVEASTGLIVMEFGFDLEEGVVAEATARVMSEREEGIYGQKLMKARRRTPRTIQESPFSPGLIMSLLDEVDAYVVHRAHATDFERWLKENAGLELFQLFFQSKIYPAIMERYGFGDALALIGHYAALPRL